MVKHEAPKIYLTLPPDHELECKINGTFIFRTPQFQFKIAKTILVDLTSSRQYYYFHFMFASFLLLSVYSHLLISLLALLIIYSYIVLTVLTSFSPQLSLFSFYVHLFSLFSACSWYFWFTHILFSLLLFYFHIIPTTFNLFSRYS